MSDNFWLGNHPEDDNVLYDRAAALQQARCPIHDVALTGFCATCPIAGCDWQAKRSASLQAGLSGANLAGYGNQSAAQNSNSLRLQRFMNDYYNLQIEQIEHTPAKPLKWWGRVRFTGALWR